jgi:transposase
MGTGTTQKEVFRPRRDFKGMERRRARAAQLFRAGKKQAEVARSLRVSRQSVSRWFFSFLKGGVKALKGAGRAGRKPRLDAKQLAKIDAALRLGAKGHGYRTNLWTLPRIAEVIERLTGVRYHPGHVWRILHRLDWSLQRPARRARERNEEAVKEWISKRWAVIKKKPEDSAAGSSSKTKAESHNGPPSTGHGRPRAKHRS